MQPFNIVHNDGFKEVIKTVAPRYKMPSRSTFTRIIDSQYYILQNEDLN